MYAPAELLQELRAKGITNSKVLQALADVPRHEFVQREFADFAYEDRPLPIDCGQTISQIYIVALMTSLLQISPEDTVLEIGTGSGYQTAVLAKLANFVCTVEYHSSLAAQARQRLDGLGFTNVHYRVGDGRTGWDEYAPYDGIIVTAATTTVPKALADQLQDGGRLIAPIGNPSTEQALERWIRRPDGFEKSSHGIVKFVPLLS